MIISHITSSISRKAGGVAPVVWSLSEAMQKQGVKVNVVGLWDEYIDEDCSDVTVPLYSCKSFGPASIGYSPAMSRALNKLDTDIIHSHGLWMFTSIVARKMATKKNVPLFISPHGMLDSWALRNSAWKKKLAGWLFVGKNFKKAACIHALCESEYGSIRKYGITNPIVIIPNGIDLPEIISELKEPWRNQIAVNKKVLLFLGRIHPKKGLENLVNAWAKLRPEEWVLAIAGWSQGGHEEELKKKVIKFNLRENVIFLGAVYGARKQACLQNADAFILPSYSEGLPMSILEGWAYSLPAIYTKECNLPEGFESGASVEVQANEESIVEGLDYFFSLSDEQRKHIGDNGRWLVEAKFTWPRIASQMIDSYKWATGRGEMPDFIRLE